MLECRTYIPINQNPDTIDKHSLHLVAKFPENAVLVVYCKSSEVAGSSSACMSHFLFVETFINRSRVYL